MFNFPKYHTIVYRNNPLTGRFEKQPAIISFAKIPFDLKVEPTQEDRLVRQGAKTIITGRIKSGNREFFTGLIPLDQNTFVGNHYESVKGVKKLSLIVFVFSDDNAVLTVYFFNHYYIDSRTERLKFCQKFINNLKP